MATNLTALLKQAAPEAYNRLSEIARRDAVAISDLVRVAVDRFINEDADSRSRLFVEIDEKITRAKEKAIEDMIGVYKTSGIPYSIDAVRLSVEESKTWTNFL